MSNSPDDRAPEPTPIHSSALNSTGAVAALGLVAATALQKVGLVSLMVGTGGYIEIIPDGELQLDDCDEVEALSRLVCSHYTDAQLGEYMRQRAIRMERNPSPQDDHR
jgi:hypothetical protein